MKKNIAIKTKDELRFDNQKMQESHDRMQSYNYLRQNRVSLWQAISVIFGTSAIILIIDLISKEDINLKFILILILCILSFITYRQSIKQTQKPILVTENMIATLEEKPKTIRGEDGVDYSVMNISDEIYEEPKKEITK